VGARGSNPSSRGARASSTGPLPPFESVGEQVSEVVRELVRRRADLVPHGRGSLQQHLVGVHGVLERWGQPERVRLAGLLHSAYSTESFRWSLFDRRERSRVRELVGPDAEGLVFAFCACTRDALLAAVQHDGGAVRLSTRWQGTTVPLERRDLAELMVIHAANLAEQTCRPSGRPAPWLAEASRFLAVARAEAEVVPGVFSACAVVMSLEQETSLLRRYRACLRAPPAFSAASRDDVVASSPVGEPLVVASMIALAAGRGHEAVAFAERALTAFDAWGTAWDKRLGLTRWRQLARTLLRDGRTQDRELDAAVRRARAVLERAGGSPPRIWTQMDALDALDREPAVVTVAPKAEKETPRDGLPRRFARYIAGLRSNAERPLLHFYPGLRARPWHDPREFAIVADLERLAPQIAEQARSVDPERLQDEVEEIARTGRWRVLFLLEMGRPHEDNLARFPAVRWILDNHRTLTSYAGSMYLSVLDPGTRVAAHQGPTNIRLRCHLGLEVPDGCGMRVGGVASGWKEGQCVVFDDSFSHEVWNDGDRRRVVLVVDLWHPDLREDEVALLAGLHRYGAANGATAKGFWARNEEARRRALEPPPDGRVAAKEDPIAVLRRAVGQDPGDARLHVSLAHELCGVDRYAEAEASVRAALAIDPALPIAHNNLGWVRQMQGDNAGAIAAYEKALELDGTFGRARRNLASLLTSLGRFAEALELRRAEVRDQPDSAPAIAALVGAAMQAGDLAFAAEQATRQAAICRGTRWYPVLRDDDPELPPSIPWARDLTPSKLLHDIEQLEYLQGHGVLREELTPIIEAYDGMLDTLAPLGPDARVPLVGVARDKIGHVYNRLLYVRPTPRVTRALSREWDARAVEEQYFTRRPNAVVVDRFLTDEAIESLRQFCLESTIWSENRHKYGRLGSMFQEGFNCPLLIQIAEELRAALPRVITPTLPARQIWGYKYATSSPRETPHADFAVVNVNFWITPDDANLDPGSGGLHLYDVAAPRDWDFGTYNSNEGSQIYALLAARNARPTHIPYRYNRAVIFDSDLIHGTPALTFRRGYENRRINVTVLYGARNVARAEARG
jgi:tetratricopeptide (TPR) repeat protein